MLVTDQAKLIRTTVGSVRVTGRNTQGVILFRVAPNEHVVSAARIEESEEEAEVVLTDEAAEQAACRRGCRGACASRRRYGAAHQQLDHRRG
jgi:DNA gyrase subunit A